MQVGIREAKAQLSSLIKRVREGEVVEITDRGKPVVKLVPVPQPKPGSYEAIVQNLLRKGIIEKAPPKRRGRLPKPVKLPPGISLLKMLREDRDSRP